MKYQFDCEKIKSCSDCPCCNNDNEYGMSCNFNGDYDLDDNYPDYVIPEWCELKKIDHCNVKVLCKSTGDGPVITFYECLICGDLINEYDKYCSECGKSIEWGDVE